MFSVTLTEMKKFIQPHFYRTVRCYVQSNKLAPFNLKSYYVMRFKFIKNPLPLKLHEEVHRS